MESKPPIRVLIADDHAIVRTGLIAVLQACEGFELVGEASNGLEAVEMTQHMQPDVVLMDLSMPIMDGPTATRLICEKMSGTKILILTSHKEEKLIQQALSAGADGYLLKEIEARELATAIRKVYGGVPVLIPEAAQILWQKAAKHGEPALGSDLTKREHEVLGLLVKGCNNQQIADLLELSRATIKLHVSNILAKLHVTGRTEAVVIALKHNLLPEQLNH